MTIGERLKDLRNKKGMLQSALARDAKVPLSTINVIESGVRSGEGLTASTLRRIANTLGVSLDQLIGRDEENAS